MTKKVRMGIVGTGNIITLKGAHIDALNTLDEIEITAVWGTNEEKNKKAVAMTKNPEKVRLCKTYEEMLKMDEVDCVLIATPNWTHRDYCVKAFEAGKHVFCEKPFEITIGKCNEIINSAKKAKTVLQVGLELRYSRFYNTIIDVINSGLVGKPLYMYTYELRQVFASTWKFDKAKSGGILVEKSCHTFDTFNWIAGAKPKRVCAIGGQGVVTHDKEIRTTDVLGNEILIKGSEILDNAWVLIEYENNVRACYGLCFFYPHSILHPVGIVCERGAIEGETLSETVTVMPASHPDKIKYEFSERKGIHIHIGGILQFKAFAESVLCDKPVFCTGEVGRDAVAVSIAAEMAVEKGTFIEIKDVLGI